MQAIGQEISSKGCNAVVTTGGIQSNHCRAVAVHAAQNGWKCKLILHGDSERFYAESGNAMFIRLAGAEVEFAEPAEIASKMDQAMAGLEVAGYKPYYIYGGGHNLKGGEAYVQAVDELNTFCLKNNWYPDYIFLASGTGSTHAGIMAGLDKHRLGARVVGISVARTRQRAEAVVGDFYRSLKSELHIRADSREVVVYDDYLAGGYEVYNSGIKTTIEQLASQTGVYTDPTYTGKAFWGMLETIKREQLAGHMLFWHTGGLNNLIASNIA